MPDLAVITLAGEGTAADLDDLRTALEEAAGGPVPTIAVLSPPAWSSPALVDTLRTWADEQGIPVIDLGDETGDDQTTPVDAARAIQAVIESWR